MNTIIIEAGATKTDWALLSDGDSVVRSSTPGMNFATMGEDAIVGVLRQGVAALGAASSTASSAGELPDGQAGPLCSDLSQTEVYIYGAGLTVVPQFVRDFFPRVNASSDLLAAARALLGRSRGIAAILGTGSNSCLYDGSDIVENIRSGGFILGDEGGAASLGRLFISDFIKGLVPSELSEEFAEWSSSGGPALDYFEIVRRVYRSEAPSAWLGSLAPWIVGRYGSSDYASILVDNNFRAFFRRSLLRYEDARRLPIGIVGGFAWACRPIIEKIASEEGLVGLRFLKSPMDGLIDFHLGR